MDFRANVVGMVDVGVDNKKNDDRIMIQKNVYESGIHENTFSFPFHCAICDGVGGEEDGDKAAEFVLNKLTEKQLDLVSGIDEMKSVLNDVNQKLISFQLDNKVVHGMKTTLVGISLYEDRVIYYNSGDSRLYRMRAGVLCKLSEDHSIAQEMILNGLITENFEEELMKCSQITRCLGVKDVLPPYIKKINIPALYNDIYLLCSDGLWGVVNDGAIGSILGKNNSLKEKLNELYRMAEDNGSKDNISIIIIKIEH